MLKRTVAATILLLILSAFPLATFAGANEGLSFSINCEGFTSNAGFVRLTRDNTGNNREAFSITAVDGAGNVIYEPVVDTFLVGGRVSFGEGETYEWTQAPTTNPISLTVTSTAGNNLPSQIVFTLTGSCIGLPSANLDGVNPIPSANNISPSVLPGQAPPVPSSNAEEVEQLPGYAIINAESLNLRSGDAPEYTIVGVARGGTRAVVVGRNDDFSWWLLEIGGVRGWANAEFLYLRGDLRDTPVLDGTGVIIPVTMVTFLPQPIYSEPTDLNSRFICNIVPGEYLVVGRDRSNEYYGIDALCEDGTQTIGWIAVEDGAVRNPASVALPILE